MPAPERRPEGTPALLDNSLGLAEQHVGFVTELPALLDEEARGFAQRLWAQVRATA